MKEHKDREKRLLNEDELSDIVWNYSSDININDACKIAKAIAKAQREKMR